MDHGNDVRRARRWAVSLWVCTGVKQPVDNAVFQVWRRGLLRNQMTEKEGTMGVLVRRNYHIIGVVGQSAMVGVEVRCS